MRNTQALEIPPELDPFEDITEEEIILLWRSFRSGGLSSENAWHAVLTGIALDMAFERSKSQKWMDQ